MNSKRFWQNYRKKNKLGESDEIDLPPYFGPESYMEGLEEFHTDEEADQDENSNEDVKKYYQEMFSKHLGHLHKCLDRETEALRSTENLMNEYTSPQSIQQII